MRTSGHHNPQNRRPAAYKITQAEIVSQVGFYTLPAGPNGPSGTETYINHNELAYGYSSPSACLTLNPRLLPPPGARCIFWTFLDASTGKQIVSSFQKIGHWHWRTDPNLHDSRWADLG